MYRFSLRKISYLAFPLCLALSAQAAPAPWRVAAAGTIKINLYSGHRPSLVILTPESAGASIGDCVISNSAAVSATGSMVTVKADGAKSREKSLTLKAGDKGAWLSGPGLQRRLYRGKITFTARDGILKIINELDLEEYLESVVMGEAGDLSQIEAHKSQAVAARTYTYKDINNHAKDGFNMCDSTHCQLFTGFGCSRDKIKKAVALTRGEILLYKESPASTFYHSICGGATEDMCFVWPYERKPYLISIKDGPQGRPYCARAPAFKWKTKIYLTALTRIARSAGWIKQDENAKKLRISARGISGRAYELDLYTERSIVKIPATQFYHAFGRRAGWQAVRSSFFEIYSAGDFIMLEGKGNGHGVGMCQWGAEGMAKKGFGYREILRHYYPQTELGHD